MWNNPDSIAWGSTKKANGTSQTWTNQARLPNFEGSNFSVSSDNVIALGRSCLLANTKTQARAISSWEWRYKPCFQMLCCEFLSENGHIWGCGNWHYQYYNLLMCKKRHKLLRSFHHLTSFMTWKRNRKWHKALNKMENEQCTNWWLEYKMTKTRILRTWSCWEVKWKPCHQRFA